LAKQGVGLVAAAGLALAGCGGTDDVVTYAGMSRDEAKESALRGAVSQTSDPASDLYRHRLVLVRVRKGREPGGEKAWVAVLRDSRTGDRFCVWMSKAALPDIWTMSPCGEGGEPGSPPPPTVATQA
jgi:hypothetical protein